MGAEDSIIAEAVAIARKDLRWCYRSRGIISGSRLVYWSWDSFFASLGASRLGDLHIVRKNLELYLSFQNSFGAIPKRIAHPWYFLRYIGLPIREDPGKQQPTFWNTYYTAPSLAQNPVFLIAFHDYVVKSKDLDFAISRLESLSKIAHYLENQEESEYGLLWEGIGGGWAESVLKHGVISFTNMCYARSLWCLADLYDQIGSLERGAIYRAKFEQTVKAINTHLWSEDDGGYYSDWYGRHRHHHFATDGNLLAICWEIASPDQAQKIQIKIDALSLEDDVPIRLAYDQYDYWRIFIVNRIGGMKDYHVGFSWTWLGCIDAVAKMKMGKKEEANVLLHRIAEVIKKDGTVHEIYDKGKAVKTPLYKSEHPWAWGAGLFLYACAELGYKISGDS